MVGVLYDPDCDELHAANQGKYAFCNRKCITSHSITWTAMLSQTVISIVSHLPKHQRKCQWLCMCFNIADLHFAIAWYC